MNRVIIFILFSITILMTGCVSLGKLSRHDFESGYYKLKVRGAPPSNVYTEVIDDSVIVYPLNNKEQIVHPNISSSKGLRVSRIKPDNYFYRSTFMNSSLDIDLTSILFKSRHTMDDVPNQFSADLNFAVFAGIRKDYYKIITPARTFHEQNSFIRQLGFDLGLFAGIGSTPINPTVTNNKTSQEYDGMIFQKGFAGFVSVNKMSVGIAVGFDSLVDKLRTSWIYNQKPYLGVIISVSGF